MKLRQIQYVCAVVQQGFSVSAAAEALYTSQPGVSKQIRMLEDELGSPIFERSGKSFTRLTEFGRVIMPYLERIQAETENVRRRATELASPAAGTLSIATTHTQARYMLPPIVAEFRARYPGVALNLHQGTPEQIAEMAVNGKVDFAIATEGLNHFEDLVLLPCYKWNRAALVPRGHPLELVKRLSLEDLAKFPLVTYVFGFADHSEMSATFAKKRLRPNLVLTAVDADVIKTYVRTGLGVGLLARMAYEPERDGDLVCLDVRHLFPHEVTSIGLRRGLVLRDYMYDFIHRFAPHLDRIAVDMMVLAHDRHKETQLYLAHIPYLTLRE
ncbi:HTH-type transcriptional regulator CysB [Acidihalobacter prosperus]|uniref:CysB family transcriptional regulator n=1 Tax=Acidihalobacter prosperus TaxID=160660 RepID=A0A1A6C567_9GAMM|nr:HTH-type transcriptional regulator CysB [Acidihalobacter prosperus]OBS09694.1 CysB family transcriptional regulator [Acidihalobacter prosperus]